MVDGLPEDIKCGVYYGWAKVDNGSVHKMVMSIGWNPQYENIKKSMVRGKKTGKKENG